MAADKRGKLARRASLPLALSGAMEKVWWVEHNHVGRHDAIREQSLKMMKWRRGCVWWCHQDASAHMAEHYPLM